MAEVEAMMKAYTSAAGGAGAGGAGAGAGRQRQAGGAADAALAPLQRALQSALAAAKSNLRKPNLNTALAASGAGCLALREVLSHDLLGAREALRGVIGGPLPEFLGRLRNLAGAAMLAAAFLKFD